MATVTPVDSKQVAKVQTGYLNNIRAVAVKLSKHADPTVIAAGDEIIKQIDLLEKTVVDLGGVPPSIEKGVPYISSLSPSSGPHGAMVTINGVNFGEHQGVSTVNVGGVPATIMSWSDTSILIKIPNAPAPNADVIVNVVGNNSKGAIFVVTP